MNAASLMKQAQESGITISLRGNKLVMSGKRSAIGELAEVIRKHKEELLNYLRKLEVQRDHLPCSSCSYFMNSTVTFGGVAGLCGINAYAGVNAGRCSRYQEIERITSPLLISGYLMVNVTEGLHYDESAGVVSWPEEKLFAVTEYANSSGGVASLVSIVRAHRGNIAVKEISQSLGGEEWIFHKEDKCLPQAEKKHGCMVTEKGVVRS